MKNVKTLYVYKVKKELPYKDCEEVEIVDYGFKKKENYKIGDIDDLEFLSRVDDKLFLHKIKTADGIYEYHEEREHDEILNRELVINVGFKRVDSYVK